MKKSTKVIITAAVVVAAAGLILPRFLKPKEEVSASAPPVVSTENPVTGSLSLYTALTGTIEPSDIVYVIPKAAGEVTQTYVKAGDMVKEGQIICQIDTKQVDGARISLDTAAISMQDANTNLDRMRVLYESGDISRQQFEQVESSAKMAKLQYEGAKLAYDNQIEFSSIKAPISGLVESFNVEVHDMVSQQNVLCVISGEGTKAVSFSVTERVVGGLQVGDTMRIEKNGSEYHGVITEISTMIDAATGLFNVKASLESAEALATGSQVKLYVTSERADNVMLIPTDAIYYINGEANVYIYQDGAVTQKAVEIGVYTAEEAEVKSGLDFSDQVIVTWSSELFNGSQVELAPENTEAAGTESEETPATEAQAVK